MSKQEIDWSKAPEGATHWEPEGDRILAGWMKLDGENWYYWPLDADPEDQWYPVNFGVEAERAARMYVRPASLTPWDGTGLPPVGTVCEVERDSLTNTWLRARVLAHDEGYVVFRWLEGLNEGELEEYDSEERWFRPARTPEQLAAEEWDKAIKAMLDLRSAGAGVEEFAQQLYDAGLRFPEVDSK